MSETVENNLAALQQVTRDAQERSLRHLKQYVWNRERAFAALARLDPDSKPARDAQDRLDKARADYEAFTASIAEAPQVTPDINPEAEEDQSLDNQSESAPAEFVANTKDLDFSN